MSVETFTRVEVDSSDVIALLRKLGIARNKMINHDTDWWLVDTSTHQYLVPSAPLVHGISYRILEDKLHGTQVEIQGNAYKVVSVGIGQMTEWLGRPELIEVRGSELALTGRKLWVGNTTGKASGSYRDVLDYDLLSPHRVFWLSHTSEMGWLPVFQLVVESPSLSNTTDLTTSDTSGLSTVWEASMEPTYTHVLDCHNADGSTLSLNGDKDAITNCLAIMSTEGTSAKKLQLTRKLIGPVTEYRIGLTIEDLL